MPDFEVSITIGGHQGTAWETHPSAADAKIAAIRGALTILASPGEGLEQTAHCEVFDQSEKQRASFHVRVIVTDD